MARGDHIRVARRGYWHHGIDCGDGAVIHYAGEQLEKKNAVLRRTPLDLFAREGNVEVVSYRSCDEPEIVIARAESRLGEASYRLICNNCEHFARWCKTGRSASRQVQHTVTTIAGLAVIVGVALVYRPFRPVAYDLGRRLIG